jgi:hypothetical protein
MMQEKRAKTEPRLLIVGRGKERREEMGIAMRSGGFDIVEAASGLEVTGDGRDRPSPLEQGMHFHVLTP